MTSLAEIFRPGPESAGEQIQGILRAVRRHLAMDVGFISEFVRGNRVFRFSDGDDVNNPIKVGAWDPLDKSFCHYVALGLMPGVMRDAAKNALASTLAVTQDLPVGAHLSVPLRQPDGTPFGSVCCFSYKPDRTLTSRDLDILRMCADVVCALIEKDRRAAAEVEARRSRISETIEAGAIEMVFQPLYRVADRHLTGFEALARFPREARRPPDVCFAEAAAVGLGPALEFLAVEKALAILPRLESSLKLTVNLSPASVISPLFGPAFAGTPVDRIVVELTEHAVVESYDALHKALNPLRSRGLRLAIDDVGAGHSNFRHVLDLAPEFIKLDRSLIHDLHKDSARRALAEALTSYGRRIGCDVVAEGIESAEEFAVLRDIGVTRAQGYLLGRPMPIEEATRQPLVAAVVA